MECKTLNSLKVLTYTSKLLRRLHARERKALMRSVKRLNEVDICNLCEAYLPGVPDLNAVMVVSLKLAFKLQIFSGSWILAKFTSPESYQRKASYRWIQIVVNPIFTCDRCYISKLLFHNLKEKCGGSNVNVVLRSELIITNVYFVTRIFAFLQSKVNLKSFVSKYLSTLIPQVASNIEVSFIKGTELFADINFDEHLNDHFQSPKCLVVGDIFAVPVLPSLKLKYDTSQSAFAPNHMFFKVISINGSNSNTDIGHLISKGHTTLYLYGSMESQVPQLEHTIETLESNVPPCLMEYFSKLCEVFELYQIDSSQNRQPLTNDDEELKKNIKFTNDVDKTKNKVVGQDYLLFGNGHFLLIGSTGSGKNKLIELLGERYSYHIHWIDCWNLKSDTSATTEAKIRQVLSKVLPCSVVALSNVGCLSEDREGNADPRVLGTLRSEIVKLSRMKPTGPFVIGTSHDESSVSDELWSSFTYQQSLSPVRLNERKDTLRWLLTAYFKTDLYVRHKNIRLIEDELKKFSHRTAGFYYGDLQELLVRVFRLYVQRMNVENTKVDSTWLSQTFSAVLDEMQSQRSEALGLPKVPKVNWKEVGGLEEAKKELINTIQLPIKHPNLISSSIRRSGILLYGPPGTGKTLLAKSVASECGLNFLSVKGPELLNMYVGQSEENVRQVFEKAKSASPCVIFFDELDSLAPNRGRSGDSGGVMDRIVSALLAELDGVSTSSDVFVLAATNRPDLLDPALLRPGRFEKQIFLGLCDTKEEQIKILKAVTSKVPLSESASLKSIVEKLPVTLTGADFSALAIDAFYIAMRRVIGNLKTGVISAEEEAKVVVTEDDFEIASLRLVPSVSTSELAAYKEMSRKRN